MTGPKTHVEYLSIRRFGALDGLRAIAILLVFTAHQRGDLWPHFNGATGVTLFFVLSGYLITTLLLREEDRAGKVDFSSFYIRRTFRIYPMYLGVVALYCVLILGLGMDSARRALWIDNLPYIVWFPEHLPFFRTTDLYPPFAGAWSIGIEEKFYLVWPVLGFLLLARCTRARIPVLAVIAAASLVTSFVDDLMYLAPYQHLAFGAVAALLLHRRRSYPAVATLGRPPVLLAVAATALVLQFGTGTEVYFYGDLYGLHGLVLALLVAGLVTTRSPAVGWLGSRPMAFLAAISYTFYLIHGFFVNAVELVVPATWGRPGSLLSAAAALSLAIYGSWIVHRLFEEPLRVYGVHLAKRLERARAKRVDAGRPASSPDAPALDGVVQRSGDGVPATGGRRVANSQAVDSQAADSQAVESQAAESQVVVAPRPRGRELGEGSDRPVPRARRSPETLGNRRSSDAR